MNIPELTLGVTPRPISDLIRNLLGVFVGKEKEVITWVYLMAISQISASHTFLVNTRAKREGLASKAAGSFLL